MPNIVIIELTKLNHTEVLGLLLDYRIIVFDTWPFVYVLHGVFASAVTLLLMVLVILDILFQLP